MTKAEIVAEISKKTGIPRAEVLTTIEAFTETIKGTLHEGDGVYLRGFGSFVLKTRAKKIGRIISSNTSIEIPEHKIVSFKPAKEFAEEIKEKFTKL